MGTPPRDTAQESYERGNSVLEPHGDFFQFRFLDFNFYEILIILTKNDFIYFFLLLKKTVVNLIIKKSEKNAP